jgi:hypothetical protein
MLMPTLSPVRVCMHENRSGFAKVQCQHHAETPTCWWLAFIVDAGENASATIVGYPGKKGQTETVNQDHKFRVAHHWDFVRRTWVSPLQSSYAGAPSLYFVSHCGLVFT